MTRPNCDDSRREHPVQYTREALEANVQGLMIVKCAIMIDGSLKNCRIIKPLPHMEQAALRAVQQWKCSPVTFQGRPVNVDYVIQLRLSMPR